MINKDRIVPITRTDLLSFYAAVLRAIDPTNDVTNVQPVDGAINLAALPSGFSIATEPVKGLVGTPANVAALYCCLDYDFQNPMTALDGGDFVANPGDIYFVGANEGQTMARELGSGRNFEVGSVE